MATIMESYDMQFISTFCASPEFQEKYGEQLPNGNYSIPAQWQLGLSLSTLMRPIIGVFANRSLAERFGPRKVMMVSYVVICALIVITFTAHNVTVLLIDEILWCVTLIEIFHLNF